jgi:hypothetical protein
MKFWACPPNNIVTVDDAPMTVDLSDVAKNIWLVDWSGKDGTILYNDRLGVRNTFSDPSPYLFFVNRWMIAAQLLNPAVTQSLPTEAVPISLGQAKAVKSALVPALFNLKRQAPIATAYGTIVPTDEVVSNMQSQALSDIAGAGSSSVGNLNDSIAGVADSMNATIADFNSKIGTFNSNANAITTAFNSETATFNSNQNYNVNYMNAGYVDSINNSMNSGTAPSGGGQVTFTPMPHQGMPVNAMGSLGYMGTLGAMNPIPSPSAAGGGGSPTLQQLQQVMGRRNSLAGVQGAHLTNIANATSVAAVAAYDITAGW